MPWRNFTVAAMLVTVLSAVQRVGCLVGKRHRRARVRRCTYVRLHRDQHAPVCRPHRSGDAFAVPTKFLSGQIGFKQLRLGPLMRAKKWRTSPILVSNSRGSPQKGSLVHPTGVCHVEIHLSATL
jgi:hypothetical protein